MYNLEKKLISQATPIEKVIVNRAYNRHKAVFENWTYGEPMYFWYDSNNYFFNRSSLGN